MLRHITYPQDRWHLLKTGGGLCEGPLKSHAVLGEFIEVGRSRLVAAVNAHSVRSLLVGSDQKYVGTSYAAGHVLLLLSHESRQQVMRAC